MDIIIVNSELYVSCNTDSNLQLKQKIEKYFIDKMNAIGLPAEFVRNIIISKMDKSNGRIDIANYSPLEFNVFIQEFIIWYLFRDKKDKCDYASSIIFHELYHCKDILNMNSDINLSDIERKPESLNELFINLGYHQYLEYRAHFNSSKISPTNIINQCSDIDLYINIYRSFKKEKLFDENGIENITYNNFISPFIRKIVILIANINSINSLEHKNELDKYTISSQSLKVYIEIVNSTMIEICNVEPVKVSVSNLYDLGKTLLSLETTTINTEDCKNCGYTW